MAGRGWPAACSLRTVHNPHCVSVVVINISLTDLLNAPDSSPVAANRPADAAAFSGLVEQFDRRQTDAPAKPARTRADHAEARDQRDQNAEKSDRKAASTAAKSKPAAAQKPQDAAAAAAETASPPTNAKASEEPAAQPAAGPSDDKMQIEDESDGAPSLPIATVVVTPIEQAPAAPSSSMPQAAQSDAIEQTAATPNTSKTADDAAANGKTDLAAAAAKAADHAKNGESVAAAADTTTQPAGEDAAPETRVADAPAKAQAADLAKKLVGETAQVSVQIVNDETPKPLKTHVALANGMSHPANAEAASAPQTAAAVAASAATGHSQSGDNGATGQSALQSATQPGIAAFAGLIEPAPEPAPAATAAKAALNAPAGIGSVSAPAQNATAPATQTAAKSMPQAQPQTEPAAEQIAVHIAKASSDGIDKINVKLKPESLGHVQVRLDVSNDGRTHVVVSADRPDTLDLLQRDAQSLIRALNDAGLQTSQQNLSFNLRDQNMPQGGGGQNGAGSMGWRGGLDGADEPLPPVGGYLNGRAAIGGLDIRV